MSKKKDLISLGEAYGDVLNNVGVSEEVKPGKMGEAPLESGGPEEEEESSDTEDDIIRIHIEDNNDAC